MSQPLTSDYMIALANGTKEEQEEYDRILADAERKARKHIADWLHEAGDRIELDTDQGFEFDCDVPAQLARTNFVGPVEHVEVYFHGEAQEPEETDPDEEPLVYCKFCEKEFPEKDAEHHRSAYVCRECWDERLVATK